MKKSPGWSYFDTFQQLPSLVHTIWAPTSEELVDLWNKYGVILTEDRLRNFIEQVEIANECIKNISDIQIITVTTFDTIKQLGAENVIFRGVTAKLEVTKNCAGCKFCKVKMDFENNDNHANRKPKHGSKTSNNKKTIDRKNIDCSKNTDAGGLQNNPLKNMYDRVLNENPQLKNATWVFQPQNNNTQKNVVVKCNNEFFKTFPADFDKYYTDPIKTLFTPNLTRKESRLFKEYGVQKLENDVLPLQKVSSSLLGTLSRTDCLDRSSARVVTGPLVLTKKSASTSNRTPASTGTFVSVSKVIPANTDIAPAGLSKKIPARILAGTIASASEPTLVRTLDITSADTFNLPAKTLSSIISAASKGKPAKKLDGTFINESKVTSTRIMVSNISAKTPDTNTTAGTSDRILAGPVYCGTSSTLACAKTLEISSNVKSINRSTRKVPITIASTTSKTSTRTLSNKLTNSSVTTFANTSAYTIDTASKGTSRPIISLFCITSADTLSNSQAQTSTGTFCSPLKTTSTRALVSTLNITSAKSSNNISAKLLTGTIAGATANTPTTTCASTSTSKSVNTSAKILSSRFANTTAATKVKNLSKTSGTSAYSTSILIDTSNRTDASTRTDTFASVTASTSYRTSTRRSVNNPVRKFAGTFSSALASTSASFSGRIFASTFLTPSAESSPRTYPYAPLGGERRIKICHFCIHDNQPRHIYEGHTTTDNMGYVICPIMIHYQKLFEHN